MIVTVTDGTEVRDEGTVLVFTGDTEDGRTVSFGVDRRIGLDLYAYLADAGSVNAEVEGWQIVGQG